VISGFVVIALVEAAMMYVFPLPAEVQRAMDSGLDAEVSAVMVKGLVPLPNLLSVVFAWFVGATVAAGVASWYEGKGGAGKGIRGAGGTAGVVVLSATIFELYSLIHPA
jgi:hypothetical protein